MNEGYRFTIALPPSANRIWRHQGGMHHKAHEYTAWLRAATMEAHSQIGMAHIPGNYGLHAVLPKTRIDLDNRCKPINDMLQVAGLVVNDSMLRRMVMEVDHEHQPDRVTIMIWPLAADPKPKRKAKKLRAPLPAESLIPHSPVPRASGRKRATTRKGA